jgi:hypothetical protein
LPAAALAICVTNLSVQSHQALSAVLTPVALFLGSGVVR